MNHQAFWHKAQDIYNLHHGRHERSILTEEELRETVTDYVRDTCRLFSEWYTTPDDSKGEHRS